jgi:hypothetical protein
MLNQGNQMFTPWAVTPRHPVFHSPLIRIRPAHQSLCRLMSFTKLSMQGQGNLSGILFLGQKSIACFSEHISLLGLLPS